MPAGVELVAPDGSWSVRLPEPWKAEKGSDASATYAFRSGRARLSIRAADATGAIRPCDTPLRPWEDCSLVHAASADALANALRPSDSYSNYSIGTSIRSGELDGEVASVLHVEGDVHPMRGLVQRGRQHVVYVIAVHDRRPYLIRLWTGSVLGLDEVDVVIRGFHFRDAPPPASASMDPAPGLVTYAENGIIAAVPPGWTESSNDCCGLLAFEGEEPKGAMSVAYGSPLEVNACLPGCERFAVEPTIPYDRAAAVADLARQIRDHEGDGTWRTLRVGNGPQIDLGRQLIAAGSDSKGEPTRRTFILGTVGSRIVLLAWSQPAAADDLVRRTLSAIEFVPGEDLPYGELIGYTSPGGYTIDVPDTWLPPLEVESDAFLPTDVRRFGDGALTIAIGSTGGSVEVCNPGCITLKGQHSMDDLRRSLAGDRTDWVTGQRTIGGFQAEMLRAPDGTDPELEHFFLFRGNRPVVITLDHTSGRVSRDSFVQMLDSLQIDPPAVPHPVDRSLEAPDGSFRLDLSDAWKPRSSPDPAALSAFRHPANLSVRRGDEAGRLRPCDVRPAPGGWETCDEVVIASLDDVPFALSLKSAPYPPQTIREDIQLDGEPAILLYRTGYEYPARGGQHLAYIVAMHRGRPYLLRFWTGASMPEFFMQEVIDGFHFVD